MPTNKQKNKLQIKAKQKQIAKKKEKSTEDNKNNDKVGKRDSQARHWEHFASHINLDLCHLQQIT